MANDTLAQTKLEKILTDRDGLRIVCPACKQSFKEPKYLFCHHFYCEKCLEKLQMDSRIICPECSEETIIPKGGIKELPQNFLTCMISNLPKGIVENLNSLSKLETVKHCVEHDSEELSFYCEDYDQKVCMHCTVTKHAGHHHVLISTLAERYQQELKKTTKSLEEVIKNLSEGLNKIELLENEMRQKGVQVGMEIDRFYQEVVDRLMQQKEKLKQQALEMMSQVENDITEEIKIKKKNLEIRQAEVSKVRQICDIFIEDASDQEIFAKKSIIDSIPQLECVYKKLTIHPIQSAILEFVSTDESSWPQLGQLSLIDPCKCEVVDLPGFVFKDCKTNVTIITKDNSRHCCFGGSRVSVQLEENSNSCAVDLQVKDNSDGSHIATIVSHQVGEAKLSILVSGQHIKGSPFSIIIRESLTSIKDPSQIINISSDKCEPWSIASDKNNTWVVADKYSGFVYIYNGKNSLSKTIHCTPGAVPISITFDDDNMYVVDSINRVQKFDKHGKLLVQFGQEKISKACGIAVYGGRVYITDRARAKRCILVFTTDGKFHFNIGSGHLRAPRGVTIDTSNQLVFVTDSRHACVYTFTLDGLYVRKFGNKGTGRGQLRSPEGLASDSNGTVFVADSKNRCVLVFNKDGTYIHSFGHDQLRAPRDIALNSTGCIYVSDSNIKIFADY